MNGDLAPFIAAAIQHPPVFLDLEKSVAKACQLVDEATELGARLVVFPETWLPGYPIWLDKAPGAALWDHPPAKAVHRRLFENSVEIPGPAFSRLCQAARANGIIMVMGVHERFKSTLYNTMLTIGPDGQLLGAHRKLIPTYTERLIWGRGDGSTLKAADTPLGRVGGLICWEHWMPLARYAMHMEQELLHVAQWPSVNEMHQVASRAYAFEGQCFVVAAGTVLQKRDLDHLDLVLLAEIPGEPEQFLMAGGSVIIAPNGKFVAGPLLKESGIITAEIDPRLAIDGRLTLDVTGHYARPDIFHLQVDTTPRSYVNRQRE